MFGLPVGLFTYDSAGGGGGGSDPFFANVKLLLHLNGANGATTTVDSANSPANVTMNGGALLSNTRVALGNTSMFLDGTNDFLNTNRTVAIGVAQFTIEFFFRPTGAQQGRIFSAQDGGATNLVIMARAEANGALTYLHRDAGNGNTVVLSTAGSLFATNDSAWYYGAMTRGANSRIDIWLGQPGGNAVSVANVTNACTAASLVNAAGTTYGLGSQFGTAEFFKGYIDEVRFTDGTCRYTANFPVPSTEFPNS